MEASVVGLGTGLVTAFVLAALHPPWWAWAIPFLVACSLFCVFLLLSPRAAMVREHGLEIIGWVSAPRSLPFDAVAEAFWEFSTHTSLAGTFVLDSVVRLVESSGRSLRLNPRAFKDAETMFARIGRQCVWPGHRRRLDAFRRGEEVAFGKLTASLTGVRIDTLGCAWSDLERVEISPVLFIFHVKGRRFGKSVRFDRVPFAFTFVQLLADQKVRLSAFDGFVLLR
jgi:hypothetical protein